MRASKSGTPVKVVILPLLASLSWKQLQIGMGMLPLTTSTSDELFNRINIDDFERFWAFKNKRFLLIFAIFGCSAHSKNELRRSSWRYRLTVCEQELLYRLSCISWALAQISYLAYAQFYLSMLSKITFFNFFVVIYLAIFFKAVAISRKCKLKF